MTGRPSGGGGRTGHGPGEGFGDATSDPSHRVVAVSDEDRIPRVLLGAGNAEVGGHRTDVIPQRDTIAPLGEPVDLPQPLELAAAGLDAPSDRPSSWMAAPAAITNAASPTTHAPYLCPAIGDDTPVAGATPSACRVLGSLRRRNSASHLGIPTMRRRTLFVGAQRVAHWG